MTPRIGAAVAAIKDQQCLSRSAPFYLILDKASWNSGGSKPIDFGRRSGEVELPSSIENAVAGDIEQQHFFGVAIEKEVLYPLQELVRRRVQEHLHIESGDGLIGQSACELLGAGRWRPQSAEPRVIVLVGSYDKSARLGRCCRVARHIALPPLD
jgi:hypothetical protein